MKYHRSFHYIAFLFLLITVPACKKENKFQQEETPDLQSSGIVTPIGSGSFINTSIEGHVFDVSDTPIENATVTLGSFSVQTDSSGYFVFHNKIVDEMRASIKVEKAGYFVGYRAIRPQSDVYQTVRVKLIQRSLIGLFNNSEGAELVVGGAKLIFESGDVSLEDGDVYDGPVRAYAAYLDPTGSDILEIMPGDLQAKDENNELVYLETYGMVVVELEGANGERLNIAPNETVQLHMAVSDDQSGSAPTTLPLWYFNETHGNWIEEGEAILDGSYFVGTISHFSFWNVDDPYNAIDFSVTLECNGMPLSFTSVELLNTITNMSIGISHTNSNGQISEPIPQGLPITMRVLDQCWNPIYTQDLGIVTSELDLGVISTCNQLDPYYISAQIVDCNGSPVSNAQVVLNIGSISHTYIADSQGEFDALITACGSPAISMTAYDLTSGSQSPVQTAALSTAVDFGQVYACAQPDQFIHFTLDGASCFLNPTNASFNASIIESTQNLDYIGISGGGAGSLVLVAQSETSGTFPSFTYPGSMLTSSCNSVNGPNIIIPNAGIDITINNYPYSVGEYFEGNCAGNFIDLNGNSHSIEGSFRIQRLE